MDLDCVCAEKYPNWKEFIWATIDSDKNERSAHSAPHQENPLSNDKAAFWLVTYTYSDELNMNHYIPYSIVVNYIN